MVLMLVVIDNYDSFTYNLVQYLGELGMESQVYRNDEISVSDIRQNNPQAVILSPGPCTPNEAGISMEVTKTIAQDIPVLGVCLGMQSIAQAYGGRVVRAKEVMHGKQTNIYHNNSPLFTGILSPFPAARYHSLVVESSSLPECFTVTAWTEEDDNKEEIMAIEHNELPLVGVQFHPESILTAEGKPLLKNFIDLYINDPKEKHYAINS